MSGNLMGSSAPTAYQRSAKILSVAANGATEHFRANGGDLDRILGHAGISEADFENPMSEIKLSQYCEMFDMAAHCTGNSNIGLHFGNEFQPKQLGMLGYAAISSPTLAAGLRHMEMYFSAHQEQTSFRMVQDEDILWLSYKIIDPRIKNRRQDAELSMGMFCNVFKAALGKSWAPLEVRFEHLRPEGSVEHEKVFNAPVEFGRRANAIAFRRRDLDAKMPEQDPYLFAVVKPFLESRSASLQDPANFAAIVRNEVKMQLGRNVPGITQIATILGMSSTAFQAQLKTNGLAYADVLKAARHELALHFMNDEVLPLTEIAHNLGYSELSAFSRAFRNWTGMSPQRYRRLK